MGVDEAGELIDDTGAEARALRVELAVRSCEVGDTTLEDGRIGVAVEGWKENRLVEETLMDWGNGDEESETTAVGLSAVFEDEEWTVVVSGLFSGMGSGTSDTASLFDCFLSDSEFCDLGSFGATSVLERRRGWDTGVYATPKTEY